VGRAEVARLKDLNNQMKESKQLLHDQLDSLKEELDAARSRIAELEAQLEAASAFGGGSELAPGAGEAQPDKCIVPLDRSDEECSSPPSLEVDAAARMNPFRALGDLGLGESASQLVAFTGEHGYVVVFGADSADGEPSARTQIVEDAAAALTASGVSLTLHKLDISELEDGSAFVVPGEDDSNVSADLCAVCQALTRSQMAGPFVSSLQELSASAAADPSSVIWLLLVGNNGIVILESLKSAVFSKTLVQTVTGSIVVPSNLHIIVETAEEENLPLPCHWVKV
jgi:hypothetical protein